MSSSDNDSDWSDVPDDDIIEMENGDEECDDVLCLFCDRRFNNVNELFVHLMDEHMVDLKSIIIKLNLDFYSYIKLINFIRKVKPSPSFVNTMSLDLLSSDELLKPVVNDDILLQYDIESIVPEQTDGNPSSDLKSKLDLAEERANLAEEFLERTLDDLNKCRKELNNLLLGSGIKKMDVSNGHASMNGHGEMNGHASMNGHGSSGCDDHEAYFSSYAHYGIHEEMLKDKVRTGTYQAAILNNKDQFEGSRVLDVGCGTSVLSMFATQAGAKEVIGVDMSEVAFQAMDIIEENQLSNIIKIKKGRAEDLVIDGKVDIIISEWMGYFLLYESMLDTVIYCRDNYLSKTGTLYPNNCSISLLALDDAELYNSKVKYWNNVYGFKMSAMKRSVIQEPLIAVVNKEKVISDPFLLKEFDLMKISVDDLDFESSFSLKIHKDGMLSALVGYFDIGFESNPENAVYFSTSPADIPTHWKQTVFFIKEPLKVTVGGNVQGRLKCKKNRKYGRALDITLDIFVDDKQTYHQLYNMA